jgi:hypothetical protein
MRPPDLKGHAEAWTIPIDPTRKDWRPDWDAGIVHYLLHCQWSHPFWSWYSVSGIHLRDIPGVRPPRRDKPNASHEVIIMALNPRMKPDPDKLATGEQSLDYLIPLDLEHQVEDLTDDQFKQLMQDIIVVIVEGRASPDQDWRQWWRSAIDATAQHIREGKHQVQ